VREVIHKLSTGCVLEKLFVLKNFAEVHKELHALQRSRHHYPFTPHSFTVRSPSHMANETQTKAPTSGTTANGEKPKRKPQAPRVPENHSVIKFNLHNDEVGDLRKLADLSDRATPDDMARAVIRQHIRSNKNKPESASV
jgi:hypothetical protein